MHGLDNIHLRIAVLGCGYWGKNIVRSFDELGALAAISDPDTRTASEISEKFGVSALPFQEILDDPSIQGVVIAAPAEQHYTLAMTALRAGKHVFVEKPIALSVDHAREMSRLAQEHGLVLMVGHLLQYHPVFEKLKELADSGLFVVTTY